MVLSRDAEAGALLLFECPLVAFQLGQHMPEGTPPEGSGQDEYVLARALFEKGVPTSDWLKKYACTADVPPGIGDKGLARLAREYSRSIAHVRSVVRVVTSNAFSLDTAVMRIKYGAAFFSAAAYLNHACNPNCMSRRMGGNMAVFALRDIKAGEEATHSYISMDLLSQPVRSRARHFFFECRCKRCVVERGSPPDPKLAALGYPRDFGGTVAEKSITAFKLALALNVGPCEVLEAGDACLQGGCFQFLRAHPLASIEITVPYLSALWKAMVSGVQDAAAEAWANDTARSPRGSRRRHAAIAATELFGAAVAQLTWAGALDVGVGRVLHIESRVHKLLLLQCGAGQGARTGAVKGGEGLLLLAKMHGESLDVLREDESCLAVCPPSIKRVGASLRQICRAFTAGQSKEVAAVLSPCCVWCLGSKGGGGCVVCPACGCVSYCTVQCRKQDATHDTFCEGFRSIL